MIVTEGTLYEQVTDYSVGTTNPLTYTRYYWSDGYLLADSANLSGHGWGWRSNFDAAMAQVNPNDTPNEVWMTLADGEQMFFRHYSDQSGDHWQREGANYDWLPGPPPETLTRGANNVWTFKGKDDVRYLFEGVTGHLQQIVYRNGYTQTLTWASGLNTAVSDNLGRSLGFGYDSNALRTSVTTSESYAGVWVTRQSGGAV